MISRHIISSGVLGQIRTADLRLRRSLLYPTELQGHLNPPKYKGIMYVFCSPSHPLKNEHTLRRRSLYPTELRRQKTYLLYFILGKEKRAFCSNLLKLYLLIIPNWHPYFDILLTEEDRHR